MAADDVGPGAVEHLVAALELLEVVQRQVVALQHRPHRPVADHHAGGQGGTQVGRAPVEDRCAAPARTGSTTMWRRSRTPSGPGTGGYSDGMSDVPSRDLRDLDDPVVVIAFGGWNDAGSAATGAVEHLSEAYEAEPVFSIDPDDFYDFQVNRPDGRAERR